jgi:UDP-N-acetylmuramoyl-tripeptide--D-alanyl-D-alanine ligase
VIALTLDEIADLAPGRLDRAPWAEEVTGIQVDSRVVAEGDLFVAVGSGADFARHAFARGAAAVLVPDDAFTALAALGGAVRARSSAQVVGITGSTGKTSTKDILAALCRPQARTVAAEGGQNNEIGLPLTLARIEPDTEIVVCEMGMRGLGQIAELCAVARPDVGVITSIGPVHLELLGTLENVAAAKAEVVAALPEGGVAVVPDERLLEPHLGRDDIEIRRFRPDDVVSFEPADGGARVGFSLAGRTLTLELPFTARYQALNMLAALHAYAALGLPLDAAQAGAAEVKLSRWRGEETELPGGGLLVGGSAPRPGARESTRCSRSARLPATTSTWRKGCRRSAGSRPSRRRSPHSTRSFARATPFSSRPHEPWVSRPWPKRSRRFGSRWNESWLPPSWRWRSRFSPARS